VDLIALALISGAAPSPLLVVSCLSLCAVAPANGHRATPPLRPNKRWAPPAHSSLSLLVLKGETLLLPPHFSKRWLSRSSSSRRLTLIVDADRPSSPYISITLTSSHSLWPESVFILSQEPSGYPPSSSIAGSRLPRRCSSLPARVTWCFAGTSEAPRCPASSRPSPPVHPCVVPAASGRSTVRPRLYSVVAVEYSEQGRARACLFVARVLKHFFKAKFWSQPIAQ
jgi:hypothetical protein